MKKLLCISLIAISSFANSTNTKDSVDELLNKLQKFQQKVMTKNVSLASDKEIKQLNKQIKLLNKKIQYLSVNKNYNSISLNTINTLKKTAQTLFYLSSAVNENNLKIYLPYRGEFKLENKNYYIIGSNDIMNVYAAYLNKQEGFDRIKREFYALKNKGDFMFLTSLITKLINYIANSNSQKTITSSGKDKYISLKSFSNCKYKINKEAHLFIFESCNIDR